MTSPTQRPLTPQALDHAARSALGSAVTGAQELTGGTFGSVWRLRLADGRDVVVKASPNPHARLLAYESGMLAEEANYLRLAAGVPGIPTAELLHVDDEYLFMTSLPGIPMWQASDQGADVTGARFESGAAIACLHAVTGNRFGYTGDRPHGGTWPEAFTAMIDAALDDGRTWDVPLPVPPELIVSLVAQRRELLATVRRPAMVHFDLWDGNVLVEVDGERARLTGLVDGERYLFGDPLIDLASPALFTTMADDHPFLLGYRSVRPLPLDPPARARLRLYQLYLYLIMTVENPSRGMPTHGERWDRISGFLAGIVESIAVERF